MVVNVTAASLLTIPSQTTGLQTLGLFLLFFFPALALIVIIVRCAGRFATSQFGWDDGIICFAMFLSLLETAASYIFIKINFIGIHMKDIPLRRDPVPGLIWNYAVQILYNPILALVKASVLIFLLRLFGQKDGVRRVIYILMVVNLAQMFGVFFAIIFQCSPIAFNWDLSIRGGHCIEQRVLYTSTAAFTILTDLLVLAVPLWIFTSLKIPRKTKFALLFVFLLGFIVTIASTVRLVFLVQGLFGLVTSTDPSFNIGFVTSAVETNLALVTASVPALTPLLRTWFPSWFGASPSGDGGQATTNAQLAPVRRINLRDLKRSPGGGGTSRGAVTELRSHTPRSSEEETMTFEGIIKASEYVGNNRSNGSRPTTANNNNNPPPRPPPAPELQMMVATPTSQRPLTSGGYSNYSRPERPLTSGGFSNYSRPGMRSGVGDVSYGGTLRGAPSAGWEPDPAAMERARYSNRNAF